MSDTGPSFKDAEFGERVSSNQRARAHWGSQAVGSHRSTALPGSNEYFSQIRQYRYGYETPFIPETFKFKELEGKRVLEIGVGNGIDAVEMLNHGAIYSGIDVTRNHLDLTRSNIALSFSDTRVQQQVEGIYEGDLLETVLPGDYDVIYSFGVLHHIAHEAEVLKHVSGLLRSDGELRIAVYASYSLFSSWMYMNWIFRNRMQNSLADWRSHVAEGSELGCPVVIKIRTRRQVQSLLESSGYKVSAYSRKGFVQNYLPGMGRFLHPNGVILNAFARVCGWYHCFNCRRG